MGGVGGKLQPWLETRVVCQQSKLLSKLPSVTGVAPGGVSAYNTLTLGDMSLVIADDP
jgi:hypothetical protein